MFCDIFVSKYKYCVMSVCVCVFPISFSVFIVQYPVMFSLKRKSLHSLSITNWGKNIIIMTQKVKRNISTQRCFGLQKLMSLWLIVSQTMYATSGYFWFPTINFRVLVQVVLFFYSDCVQWAYWGMFENDNRCRNCEYAIHPPYLIQSFLEFYSLSLSSIVLLYYYSNII